MKISAILLMAGSSIRFGTLKNKNFYEINKKPIFLYSLDILNNYKMIDDIYLVVKKDEFEEVSQIINSNYDDKIKIIIARFCWFCKVFVGFCRIGGTDCSLWSFGKRE